MKARYKIKQNVTYQVKDRFGNLKKLFQEKQHIPEFNG